MSKIELLAPAGDLARLKVALQYGADAIYLGGKQYSLRARASNFTLENIKQAVEIANEYDAKIYVTCNIIAHNEDLADLNAFKTYISNLHDLGVTGVIVADFGFISLIKQVAPDLEIHISTQLSTLNIEAIKFLEDQGVKRVVLGRECSLNDIKKIAKQTKMELEVFIHGGMCMSVSGKCVLSNYLADRDANRGGCAHSCRWYYDIYDEHKNLVSEQKFTFSSKDLQVLKYIKQLYKIGVKSLKIEGRMKSEHYLATVVGTYRSLLNDIYDNKKINYHKYIQQINKASNRPTSDGFYSGQVTSKQQIFDRTSEKPSQEFIAKVLSYDKVSKKVTVEQRNYFSLEDELEIYLPTLQTLPLTIKKLFNEKDETIEIARHAKEVLYFYSEIEIPKNSFIRKIVK